MFKTKMTMITLLMALLTTGLFATDYMVVGAGTSIVNGTYTPDGTNNMGYSRWKHVDAEIYLHGDGWMWTIGDDPYYPMEKYYGNMSQEPFDDTQPPFDGWECGMEGEIPPPSITEAGKGISYSVEVFIESSENDGSISNAITITHNNFEGEIFSGNDGDDFVADGKVLVYHLPYALTAIITKVDSLTLSAELTGAAMLHNNLDDVSDLTFEFQNVAFSGGDADSVTNSTQNLAINFMQEYYVASSGGDFTLIADALNDCGDGDVINLAGEVFTEAGLEVNHHITIRGEGADQTIVQAHTEENMATDRVFYIGEVSAIIENLTVRHGKTSSSGGGIYNSGNLTLTNVSVCNNVCDAAWLAGGGIYHYGSSLILINCTINDNVVTNGDVWNRPGGGINGANIGANTVLTNTTMLGNYPEAITTRDNTNLTLINCTITNNGAGMNTNWGTITIYNTLIANNDVFDWHHTYGGNLTDNGYNIIENQTGYYFTNPTNILYSHDNLGNAQNAWTRNGASVSGSLNISGVLADNEMLNGTQTIALLDGSFAIDAGTDEGAPETDQRGFGRNGVTDIGAFEFGGLFINITPVADDIAVTTDEDVAVAITMTGSDADGDVLTFAVVTAPVNGIYDGTTYTPNADWFGVDTFTYLANDGIDDSEIATVTITVNAVFDAPEMQLPESLTFAEDGFLETDLGAYISNPDDLVLSYFVSGDEHINVVMNGGVAIFTAETNWHGSEVLTFTIVGEERTIVSDNVLVIVEPQNDAPTIEIPDLYFAEDGYISLDVSGFIGDIDGDNLVLTASETIDISVTINGFAVTFISPENWFGSEIVTFTVSDGVRGRELATDDVLVTVTSVNDAPVANAGENQTVDEGNEVILSGSGTDVENDNLTYFWTAPDGIVLSDETTQNPSFTAPEVDEDTEFVLNLLVNDGELDSESDSVLVTVNNTMIAGDPNFDGVVNVQDVILTVNFALGMQTPTDDQQIAADINEDGNINVMDVVLIVNLALGIEVAKLGDSEATLIIQGDKITIESESEIAGVQLDLVGVNDFVSGNVSYSSFVGLNKRALFVNTDGAPVPSGLLLTAEGLENAENVIIADRSGKEMDITIIVLPTEFGLSQNYPNPFNPVTTINYQLPVNSNVSLQIYNIRGQLMTTLLNGEMEAGYHEIQWNGQNALGQPVSSGVYFYRLSTPEFQNVKKMVVLQ